MKRSGESSDAPETADQPVPVARRILVVDDDSPAREMVTRVLAGEGYAVWAAADVKAAVDGMAATRFDLVLLDMNLRKEILAALTLRESAAAVIIMTARSHKPPAVTGADALLEKPLDFTKLLETVSRLVAKTK